jgi:hypothetical protein
VPTVGTMEMDLGVSAVPTRTFVDNALAALGRSVNLDIVAVGRLRPAGRPSVVSLMLRDTRCTRARHVMVTHRATFVHGRIPSTRRCAHFEPRECR